MSDIVENLKDAIDPSRREKATVPAYDPQKRGPYADQAGHGHPEVAVPKAAIDDSTAEQKPDQAKEFFADSDTRAKNTA